MTEDPPVEIHGLRDLIGACAACLGRAKAGDVVGIDLNGRSQLAEYMLIASGTSDRHVIAVAQRLEKLLRRSGVRNIRLSGLATGEWVIVDLGVMLVHILRPEARSRYRLEELYRALAAGDGAP